MSTKLEDLRTCNDLIVKHGHALQRSVTDLETATSGSGGSRVSSGPWRCNTSLVNFSIPFPLCILRITSRLRTYEMVVTVL